MKETLYDAGVLYSTDLYKLDFIISLYGEYNIYSYYLGHPFLINSNFSSPFREDHHPSFGVFKNKSGRLLYKDLKYGDSGNVLQFIRRKFPYLRNNKEAALRIHIDFYTNNISKKVIYTENSIPIKSKTNIGINRGTFTDIDFKYWSKYNIDIDILNRYNVYRADTVYVDNNIIWVYEDINPVYAYKIFDHFKIYRPLEINKRKKWLGNCNRFDIFGYEQLPNNGELLIITKSGKDVMCLNSLGYNAISPSAETTIIPINVIKELQNRFKKIIIFYDNDEAGLIAAKKMEQKYNLPIIFIPIEKKAKDITDYIEKYGIIDTEQLMLNLLKPEDERKS